MWTLTACATQPILPAMLLAELADFVTRHRPCGQLTGDATEPGANGYTPTVGCGGGVRFPPVGDGGGGGKEMSELATDGRAPSCGPTICAI
jgi:hypothetical protein